MKEKVSVIGAGSWGTALAVLAAKQGYEVTLWARKEAESSALQADRENKKYLPGVAFPDSLAATSDLQAAMKDAKIVILAVPSRGVREIAKKLAPLVQEDQILVNVAKGLEEGSLLRLSQVIRQEIPHVRLCVLSGPSHAEEVGKDIPTTCLVASEDEETAKTVQQAFMSPTFRLYTNTDVIGVEIGAALKNIIALAAGMSDGLGYGDNTKAALMTRGMTEMKRLGIAMGGKAETFFGLSGIGDLIVTCTSMHSRNRRAGILLGQGKSLEETLAEVQMVVEGVNTVQAAVKLAKEYQVSMPITESIYAVLFEGKDVHVAIMELMTREGKAE